LYEEAKKAELPKLLSGAANKRLKIARERKEKTPDKLTEEDKLLLEFSDYLYQKRQTYFAAKKRLEAEKAGLGAAPAAAAAAAGATATATASASNDASSKIEQAIEKAIDSMEVDKTEPLNEDALLA
jgi:hydroxymethylpyrimidine/phosphomethylpyrimidine kinase